MTTTPLPRSRRLMLALLVLCLLLAVAVGVGWSRDDEPARRTGAISSVASRDEALAGVGPLTETVLSYSWRTLDEDVAAAEKASAPSFRTRYDQTIAGVRAKTIANQVTLEAKAVSTSVVAAGRDKVLALVFVDQVTTARGAERRVDENRLLVTVTRDGGEWRVSKMDAF